MQPRPIFSILFILAQSFVCKQFFYVVGVYCLCRGTTLSRSSKHYLISFLITVQQYVLQSFFLSNPRSIHLSPTLIQCFPKCAHNTIATRWQQIDGYLALIASKFAILQNEHKIKIVIIDQLHGVRSVKLGTGSCIFY